MNDAPQAHLVMLVAGACLAASLLAVAAGQGVEADRARARDAADALASAVAFSGCAASTPEVAIGLQGAHSAWARGLEAATLHESTVRIRWAGGETYASVAFRPVLLHEPLDLLGGAALLLTYDPFAGACLASLVPA
ncbi:MAG TPA: hypothetical protein VGB42_09380 [Candidatus Thermoplasmatota archaeon]